MGKEKKNIKKINATKVVFFILVLVALISIFVIKNPFKIGSDKTDEDKSAVNVTSANGIPFLEILTKISEEAECDYEITEATIASSVEDDDGNLLINQQLGKRQALIFDRDSLTLAENKIPDDFIIGDFCSSSRVYPVEGEADLYICKEIKSIARVILFDIEKNTMQLLWQNNNIFFDSYLPINAIIAVDEFDKKGNPVVTNDLYDENKLIVEIIKDEMSMYNECQSGRTHIYFNDDIPEECVAIINEGNNYYAVTDKYTDFGIHSEGPNHYSVLCLDITRILIYSPTDNKIQLIYE